VIGAAEGMEIVVSESVADTAGEHVPRAPRVPTRARILVADDDDSIAKVLERALGRDGYEVTRAVNGQEAVKLASQHEFDLILLDVQMPVMDGFAACRAMRADERLASIPIVMLTGRNEEEYVMTGFAEGVTDYMTKPFAVSQVRARVRAWLMRPPVGDAQAAAPRQ